MDGGLEILHLLLSEWAVAFHETMAQVYGRCVELIWPFWGV